MKNRIYLDNCCFNRPYDDQSYLTIYLESQAKLYVQGAILKDEFELVWSYILDYENSVNPHEERQNSIIAWRNVANIKVGASKDIDVLCSEIMKKGIKEKDALHVACAIKADCEYFLTTDKKLLNKKFKEIVAINPLDFVRNLEV